MLFLLLACARRPPAPDMHMNLQHFDQTKRFLTIEGQVVIVDEGQYQADVGQHVQDRWLELMHAQDRPVRVPKPEYRMMATIQVANGGEVLDVHVTESSGSSKLDALLLQAIGESSPLPAPPPELVSEGGQFAFDLRWEVVNHDPVE